MELPRWQLAPAFCGRHYEVAATELLGEDWKQMLIEHGGTRVELIARAIKDHLADAMITLPAMVFSSDATAIHLYFANLQAIRELLFPQLMEAYKNWCRDGSMEPFKKLMRLSQEHWMMQAEKLLHDFNRLGGSLTVPDDEITRFQPDFTVH